MANGPNCTLVFADGKQYRGGFLNNKYHGKGDLLYSQTKDYNGNSIAEVGDLESYDGQFKNG